MFVHTLRSFVKVFLALISAVIGFAVSYWMLFSTQVGKIILKAVHYINTIVT